MEPLTRDPQLWQQAKARAKFKSHLSVYLLVNAGLWLLWLLTDRNNPGARIQGYSVPWPAWTTLFWGIGLVANFLAVYMGIDRNQRTQREYERLVRRNAN